MEKLFKVKRNFFAFLAILLALIFAFTGCANNDKGNNGNGTGDDIIDEDPYVTELVIASPPIKTEYKVFEKFDTAGMTLVAIWSHKDDDGNNIEEEIVPEECDSISPSGAIPEGTTGITFTYEGKSVVQPITLSSAELTNVEFDFSQIGSTLLPGVQNFEALIQATAHFSDGTTLPVEEYTVKIDGETVENPQSVELTAGRHTIGAYYGDYSKEIDVFVVDGYTVEPNSLTYSDYLEDNRDALIGTNFIENPNAGIYTDTEGKNVAISSNGNPVYNKDGEKVNDYWPSANYYRVITEMKGDKQVSYLGDVHKGNIMRYHIYSEVETRVELILNVASGYMLSGAGATGWEPTEMGEMQFNKTFEVNRIEIDPETNLPVTNENGEVKTDIEIGNSVVLPGSKSETPNMELWLNLVDVSFGEVTLNEGDNVFELTVISEYKNYLSVECAANVGAFKVHVLPDECEEHKLVKVEGTPSTCITYGTQEYWRCSGCSRTYSDDQAENRLYNAPLRLDQLVDHTPGEAATCEHEQKCTVCNAVLAEKTPHTFEDGAPTCLEEKECKVCKTLFTGEHVNLHWVGNEAQCDTCGVVGKRYVVQAEDESKVELSKPRKVEDTTFTSDWTNTVSNGSEGGALSGFEWNNDWKYGDTLTVKFNVDKAGKYKLGMRTQANMGDGSKGTLDLSQAFLFKVNDGEYAEMRGKAVPSTEVGSWHKAYNWGLTYYGEADFNAGENIITFQFLGKRGGNIDYFFAEETVDNVARADYEIVYVNGQTNEFEQNATTKFGALENVVLRLAVSADKQEELGCAYRDYMLTDEILGGLFDTSTAGEHTVTLTLPDYIREYTNLETVEFSYIVK